VRLLDAPRSDVGDGEGDDEDRVDIEGSVAPPKDDDLMVDDEPFILPWRKL
jgi:hypothetical protein